MKNTSPLGAPASSPALGKQPTRTSALPVLTPKLRFPEFRQAKGWTEKPLHEVAQINSGNDGLPESFVYIDLESVEAGKLRAKTRILRNGAPSRAQRLLKRGDIIYQIVRPYQRNNWFCEFDDDDTYVASTGYAQLRAKGSNHFLYQSVHADPFVERVIAKCTGSNYPAINSSDLAQIELPLPPTLPEEEKIAECLSTLDELIGAESQKLDALKTHKKGLMQQLFPREGETLPRLRFPEFRDAPDWELSSIQNLIEEGLIIGHLDGNHGELYPRAEDFSSSGVPYITANDFADGLVDFARCRHLPEARASKFRKGVAKDGDILFAHNATVGPVAKLSTSLNFVILSTTATYFRCDLSRLDNDFLKCALTSPAFVNQYSRVMAQSTRNQVPITAQRKFFLQAPSVAEQLHIASCFSLLDDLSVAQHEKLEALKTHKRGLMQQLFPAMEAVSA